MLDADNAFSHLIGNDHIKRYLTHMVEKNAVPHSLLFSGPKGVGKAFFAKAFAGLILNNTRKTDLRFYHPEGKLGMHSIESMRELIQEAQQPPYESSRKIIIIDDADRMLPYSANALLKIVEEPPLKTVIILISSAPERILPTMISRCCRVRFHALPDKATQQEEPLQQKVLHILAQGKMIYPQILAAAKELSSLLEQSQEQIEAEARHSLLSAYSERPTGTQQQAIEKEVEGIVAMQQLKEAYAIFDTILYWYRDMVLLHTSGKTEYLYFPGEKERVDQALQRGEMVSLEVVHKAIAQATLALERSTPIKNCLENLFLQLC